MGMLARCARGRSPSFSSPRPSPRWFPATPAQPRRRSCPRSNRPRRRSSGSSWSSAHVASTPPGRPPAGRCAASSTPRPTGCGSRPGSPHRRLPARSTTSRCRRSRPARRRCGTARRRRSARWGRTSTRSRRSTGRAGRQWVAQNNSTWFEAGVEARRRMAAAGYDVSKGDTWAVNEFSVRGPHRRGQRPAERARSRPRPLQRDGGPTGKGAVFVVGVGQSVRDTTLYQTNLQNWCGDSGVLDRHDRVRQRTGRRRSTATSRKYAVPGTSIAAAPRLAERLPPAPARPRAGRAARDRARRARYVQSDVAARWRTPPGRGTSGYGWTAIPSDQMQSFVSAQVYALRVLQRRQPASRRTTGASPGRRGTPASRTRDFAAQTGAILDRLAAAIRDSAAGRPIRPTPASRRAPGPAAATCPARPSHRSGSRSGRGRSRYSPSRARRRRSRPARRQGRSPSRS